MRITVMRPDGTLVKVRSTALGSMLKAGEIVAYQCTVGWIEVRRRQRVIGYEGPQRRKSDLQPAMAT